MKKENEADDCAANTRLVAIVPVIRSSPLAGLCYDTPSVSSGPYTFGWTQSDGAVSAVCDRYRYVGDTNSGERRTQPCVLSTSGGAYSWPPCSVGWWA